MNKHTPLIAGALTAAVLVSTGTPASAASTCSHLTKAQRGAYVQLIGIENARDQIAAQSYTRQVAANQAVARDARVLRAAHLGRTAQHALAVIVASPIGVTDKANASSSSRLRQALRQLRAAVRPRL